MSKVQQWFQEALAVPDPVMRSEALGDLAFDAENMARSGARTEAIELFELLAQLDPHDDLLHPAIESAEKHLVSLGVRTLPPLADIVAELQARFASLPQPERSLAVARTVTREHGKRRPEAWLIARDLLQELESVQPLVGKDLRFRAEVLQRAAETA